MGYKDKDKLREYQRKYYKEYYHKNKPLNVKTSSIKNGTLILQYHKIMKTRTDFFLWVCKIKEVNDELMSLQKID
jgi:hypothetical protein